MVEKAVISPAYRRQLGLMGLMLLGGSLWFMYDGFVTYPHKRHIAQEFARFKDEGKEDQWAQHAQQRGWPDGRDGEPGHDYSDWDIRTQKIIAFSLLPIALVYCFSFIRSFGKSIQLQPDAIVASWGQRMAFDSVTALHKGRWKTKGIAVAHYQADGKKRKFVLDNWKYSRQPINEMLKAVEQHLTPDQIIDGVPEPVEEEPPLPQDPDTTI